MFTKDLDYNLPKELIAQEPVVPKDHSRLMVIDREKQTIQHRYFYDIIEYLLPGDLLVWNNSKVFKARLLGRLEQKDNGVQVEIFLLRPNKEIGIWQAMARPGKKIKIGDKISFAPDFFCNVVSKESGGTILVNFDCTEERVREMANKYGEVPVPPYIKKIPDDLETYQNVYAKPEGSVAAPTAGFHFTQEMIEKIKKKGVEFAELTLHVGLGTFQPIKSEKIDEHKMHSEWVELESQSVEKINKAKADKRRIVVVGTTTMRALEGIAKKQSKDRQKTAPVFEYKGEIDLFIKPGFDFVVADALITNFHLPKSTLLLLVSAFANSQKFVLNCYQEAVKEKYRFYSFGDAMFIN